MRKFLFVWLCSLALLASCAFGASSAAAAAHYWMVKGKQLAVSSSGTGGIEAEGLVVEGVTFTVEHQEIECKKVEFLGPSGMGHAHLWNQEVALGVVVGRTEGVVRYSACINHTNPMTCTVEPATTSNKGEISGTLGEETTGTPKKTYVMLVPVKWEEKSPATFGQFIEVLQSPRICGSGVIEGTGFAAEIVHETEESSFHIFKFPGGPCYPSPPSTPITEVELANGMIGKPALRFVPTSTAAVGCGGIEIKLVSKENFSVK